MVETKWVEAMFVGTAPVIEVGEGPAHHAGAPVLGAGFAECAVLRVPNMKVYRVRPDVNNYQYFLMEDDDLPLV